MSNTSDQEVFNKVLFHLGKQRRRAITHIEKEEGKGSIQCRYKTAEGLKCAIGFFIPDEQYSEDLENAFVGDVFLRVKALADMDTELLYELQEFHDKPQNWDSQSANPDHAFSDIGLRVIQQIAENYDLKVPEAFAASKITTI